MAQRTESKTERARREARRVAVETGTATELEPGSVVYLVALLVLVLFLALAESGAIRLGPESGPAAVPEPAPLLGPR